MAQKMGEDMTTDKDRYDVCCGQLCDQVTGSSVPTLRSMVNDEFREEAFNKIKKSFKSLKDFKPSSATVDRYHWNKRYLEVAKTYAGFSKDPSTKTGAVIVDQNRRIVAAGFNGIPAKIEDTDERLNNREVKYKLILHAEINAILNSTQDLTGCTVFVYPLPPCLACCMVIIQAGISKVVAPKLTGGLKERWGASCEEAQMYFKEARVEVVLI